MNLNTCFLTYSGTKTIEIITSHPGTKIIDQETKLATPCGFSYKDQRTSTTVILLHPTQFSNEKDLQIIVKNYNSDAKRVTPADQQQTRLSNAHTYLKVPPKTQTNRTSYFD